MTETTLNAEQLIQVHVEGMVVRGTSPFEDPASMNRYREVLTRRGEQWASSILSRDLSRRSLTWGPWLDRGEPEILIVADRAEAAMRAEEAAWEAKVQGEGLGHKVHPDPLAAIKAVLELHQPVDRGTGAQCKGCATHITFTEWPCPTIRAISRELKGKSDGT